VDYPTFLESDMPHLLSTPTEHTKKGSFLLEGAFVFD